MKRTTPLAIAVLSLGGILSASLGAQSLPSIQANIPFEFTLRGVAMPAGEYTVSGPLSPSGSLIQVKHAGGSHESVFIQAIPGSNSARNNTPTLTFHRYGNQCFLAKISSGDGNPVRELNTSAAEREAMKIASSHPVETVTLMARLAAH